MEALAKCRHVRISPYKARLVVDLIRGKSVKEALAILRFAPNRASRVVEKVVRSAIANAENNYGMDRDELYVAKACVDPGPLWKRYQPRQRGQAFPILKRTCHITVAVGPKQGGKEVR